MDIVSSYATIDTDTLTKFNSASTHSSPVLYELRKLSQELCSVFGLKVEQIESIDKSIPECYLVFADSGLRAARCWAQHIGFDKGIPLFRYFFSAETIKKEKASAFSARDTRDSTKIQSLIRAIRKNDEEPSLEAFISNARGSLNYAFDSIGGHIRSRVPRLELPDALAFSCLKSILGIDNFAETVYLSQLQDKYEEYIKKLAAVEAANVDASRYAKGMWIVGVMTNYAGYSSETKTDYYVLGEATNILDPGRNREWKFHAPLKRYNKLSDSPIAPTALMINTYMQTLPTFTKTNDLGVPRGDKHYPEIDIAVGHTNSKEFWVLIPKHGS